MESNFYDAILRTVTIDWEARAARLVLDTTIGSEDVAVHGLEQASIPMHRPWGPSSS